MGTQPYKNANGKRVPGVTTIIGTNLGWNKNALFYWAVKMMKKGIDPIKDRDKAAELGTLVHDYIESYIYGAQVDAELKKKFAFDEIVIAERGLDQFKMKEQNLGLEWKEVEMPLVSEEMQYGGCLDGLAEFDMSKISPVMYDTPVVEYLRSLGKERPLILTDTKTSNDIYPDHIIQLSAYRNMLLECTDYRPDGSVIIKVSKDKETIQQEGELVKFIPISSDMLDEGFEIFKVLRELHNVKYPLEKRVKGLYPVAK